MQDIAAVAIIETLEQLEYDTLVRTAYLDFGNCYLSFTHLHVLSQVVVEILEHHHEPLAEVDHVQQPCE